MRGEGEGGMASLGVYMYLSVLYWFIIIFLFFRELKRRTEGEPVYVRTE